MIKLDEIKYLIDKRQAELQGKLENSLPTNYDNIGTNDSSSDVSLKF